jgi:hypothetical protein
MSPAPFPFPEGNPGHNLILRCCVCDTTEIEAPQDATSRTRFWCKSCCEQIWIARHIVDARDVRLSPHWPLDLENAVHLF